MSYMKIREGRDRHPPTWSQNKDSCVNRLHSISTNNVRSRRYGTVFMQRFRPNANFLATGHPVILEHNVNI